ncbi:sulfurtransferase [Candidatus Amarobacter glycogenicus]|uniref:sulfurtransferase n=1 Tax=Candidatus Amarobacter glycogenicus TaxID=3140699 RepID=UPI0031348762|nr:sulfurtransferase [Dehalococcoidia bacterium]
MPVREDFLASSDWLAGHLDDEHLRVLDCTVFLRARAEGGPGYLVETGEAEWLGGHIPGSIYADLHNDLSDRSSALRFMMPPAAQFETAMGSYGVGNDSKVVLYDRAGNMWAARVWWMLRAFGFDNARVLDGGWKRWTDDGHPVETGSVGRAPGRFTVVPRPRLIASRDEVLELVRSGDACIVNALNGAQFRGEVAPYGRPGRIAGSVHVPAIGDAGVVDPRTQTFGSVEEIRARFIKAGAEPDRRLIAYCGGGIAASSTAFAAVMAGFRDVAVYDASLSEWAADPTLPMETG